MKIINEFHLIRENILLPVTLKRACRFIIDNLKYDLAFEELAKKLKLTAKSNKKDINNAIFELKKYIPYYTEITHNSPEGDSYDVSYPVRLVRTSSDNLCKVLIETDILNFCHTILNNTQNYGVKVNVNDYVSLDDRGKIIRNFSRLNRNYKPLSDNIDEFALRLKSFQIKFLSLLQLGNIPIYTVVENSVYSNENCLLAYLFTIGLQHSLRFVVLESLTPGKATYAFIIYNNQFSKALGIIRRYFSSKEPNKRSSFLDANNIFSLENGFIKRLKIIHDAKIDWETSLIEFCTQYI